MSRYRLVDAPTRIPVPGGKLIEELFGRVHTGTDAFSLAHMVAPPGWGEPAQRPEFAELTILLRGQLEIVVDEETLVLRAGQAFFVEPNVRVRYGNPFAEPCEYYAICTPAFDPRTVHREDEPA